MKVWWRPMDSELRSENPETLCFSRQASRARCDIGVINPFRNVVGAFVFSFNFYDCHVDLRDINRLIKVQRVEVNLAYFIQRIVPVLLV